MKVHSGAKIKLYAFVSNFIYTKLFKFNWSVFKKLDTKIVLYKYVINTFGRKHVVKYILIWVQYS